MEKIVIVGAGPAGLTAALELLRSAPDKYDVTILERAQVVGGISRTVVTDRHRMDMGGHRFFSKMPEVTGWWQSLLPLQGAPAKDDKILGREPTLQAGGPDPETTDDVMLVRRRISRIYYNGKFFDYPITMSMRTIRNLGFLTMVSAGFSYLYAICFPRPETSLENFYINRFGRKLYGMFFEGYTEKLWGRHPSAISADWGAQRVKGLSIGAVLKDIFSKVFHTHHEVETSLIESFWYPKFGPGQMWEHAANEITARGGRILFGSRVSAFELSDERVRRVCFTRDGREERLDADTVISSMPIVELINGMPQAPDDVKRIANGLPYRDFVTIGLLVEKLSLQNKTGIPTLGNIVPDCWIYIQDASVRLGRVQVFNNWSPYMVQNPENTVWIGLEYFCDEGDAFWNMPESDAVAFAVGELVQIGILSADAAILHSHREYVEKAYPAYFDTYDEFPRIRSYLTGYENLYCVGRNGQHRYNNMDHSMATAMEAARNILFARKEKDAIWDVNTEKAYHEETQAK